MYPGLQITRSFGDILAHDIGVISTPTIFHHYFEATDSFIVLGTEGVWNNIEENEIQEVINEFNPKERGNAIEIVISKIKESLNDGDVSMIFSYL